MRGSAGFEKADASAFFFYLFAGGFPRSDSGAALHE
jgi:hypothetical protein